MFSKDIEAFEQEFNKTIGKDIYTQDEKNIAKLFFIKGRNSVITSVQESSGLNQDFSTPFLQIFSVAILIVLLISLLGYIYNT